MAEGKKAFILYCDLIHTLEHLTMEQRGEIFTWLLDYVNDKSPKPLPGLMAAVVEPIMQQLKRDLKKYEQRAQRSRENGAKGGRPPNNPKEPTGFSGNPDEPKKPDTVTVTGTDKDINIPFSDFWDLYGKKVGGRDKCEKKWVKLKDEERQTIIDTLPAFKKSVSDKQYLPYPETYLNNRRWEDQIEPPKSKYEEMSQKKLMELDGMGLLPKEYEHLIDKTAWTR